MNVLRGRLESGPRITVNYFLYMSSNADEPWKDTHRCSRFDLEMTYLISHPAKKKKMSLISVYPKEQKQACVCFCECRPNLETWNCISEPYEPQFSSSHLLYTSLSSYWFCHVHYIIVVLAEDEEK